MLKPLAMSACSLALTNSRRMVFMLIDVASCRTGMTNAPPLTTTFCPPSPEDR